MEFRDEYGARLIGDHLPSVIRTTKDDHVTRIEDFTGSVRCLNCDRSAYDGVDGNAVVRMKASKPNAVVPVNPAGLRVNELPLLLGTRGPFHLRQTRQRGKMRAEHSHSSRRCQHTANLVWLIRIVREGRRLVETPNEPSTITIRVCRLDFRNFKLRNPGLDLAKQDPSPRSNWHYKTPSLSRTYHRVLRAITVIVVLHRLHISHDALSCVALARSLVVTHLTSLRCQMLETGGLPIADDRA